MSSLKSSKGFNVSNKKKVLIVGGDSIIANMFSKRGWDVTTNTLDPSIDLVQFTGGEDVTPSLYGEQAHAATSCNPARDDREAKIFLSFKNKVPMAGICRGAQFLNVMNKGSMWQHVTIQSCSQKRSASPHYFSAYTHCFFKLHIA